MYRYNSERSGIGIRGPKPSSFTLKSLFDFLAVWQDRRRQRQTLARLDDRMLSDIGLTAADVDAEISKPFWR
jgi:uncharacterized protein YjiS (DUF1127 family)